MRFTAVRDTLQDFRYAWRQLRHAPGFTAVAVLTLALGIGANTAFFAIANALAYRPIAAAKLDGVFIVDEPARRGRSMWPGLSVAAFRGLEARPPDSVAALAAAGNLASVTAQVPGKAERVFIQSVSGGYASLFGVSAQAGRWISEADDAPVPVPSVVISDRLWRTWFGADRATVGAASLKINLEPFTIVGVAPAQFAGLEPDWARVDLWVPLTSVPHVPTLTAAQVDALNVGVFVRPRPGAPAARLDGEIGNAIAAGRTVTRAAPAPTVRPMSRARSSEVTFASAIVVGISGLILVAACANLANMLLARGTQRMGETAVRLSLGASATRVLRLFIAETAIIAMLATIGGLALALGTLSLFESSAPGFGAFSRTAVDLSPDYRVFLYALGAGAAATLVVGVGTSWRASRVPPLRTLAGAGAPAGLTARGGRLRTGLVAVQVTIALLFVMGAGLFWEQYKKGRDRHGPPVQTHYDVDRLTTARIDLAQLRYNETQRHAFFDRLIARVRALPGVEHAAITDGLITSGWINLTPDDPPGGRVGSPRLTRVNYGRISPGFLDTIGVRLIRGRDVTAFDLPGAPHVAIISESAAADLAAGEDAIGKRVQFGPWDWLTIVGVVADPVSSADRGPTRPANVMFIPFAQWHQADAIVALRSATPAAMLEPLRAAIRAVDDDVAVFGVSTVREDMRERVGAERAMNVLMLSQSALALAIAMLGVYGVVAYFVSMRTREFGIRMALGATPGGLVKLVLDHTIHIMLVGLLPGVLIASLTSRVVQTRMFDFMPNDIPTWFAVPVLILAAGLLAGYIPARRAARVDPNVALREL